jgi:hypothetical protein
MTKQAARNKLYEIIAKEFIGKKDVDISEEAITECLKEADIFARAPGGTDTCFNLAVRNHNTRVMRIILNYYKKHNLDLNFEMPASKNKELDTTNLLQFVFKYGNREIFDDCCDFIGNNSKVKTILNKPIDLWLKVTASENDHVNARCTIWEETLLGIYLQILVTDTINTLNHDKYNKETIKYLMAFFRSWKNYSNIYSNREEPNLKKDWETFAQKNNLPPENPLLNDPIEFIIDPSQRFISAIAKNLIDLEYRPSSSNLNFMELVSVLSKPTSDPFNKDAWENLIPGLLPRYIVPGQVRLSSDLEETESELKSLAITFISNLGLLPISEEIKAKVIFDFRKINLMLTKAIEKSNEDTIAATLEKHEEHLRRHSLRGREQEQNIKELLEQTNDLVEIRRNKYAKDASKSDLAKTCFAKLCTTALNRMELRTLATDGLFTANTVTDASKYAAVAGQALQVTASLIPITGASIIPAVYEIGRNYVTGNYAKKQSEGVKSTSIKVNLPLMLVELSEAATDMLMKVAGDIGLNEKEVDDLVLKISNGIKLKIDSLHEYIKDNPDITKETLRNHFAAEVINVISEFVERRNKPAHPVLYSGKKPVRTGYSSDSTEGHPSPGGPPYYKHIRTKT